MAHYKKWTAEQIPELLVKEMHDRDGLAPVDLERFWAEQDKAIADPFGRDIPQVAMGLMMHGDACATELGIAVDTFRYNVDPAYRVELHKLYNDKAERIVGRRVLDEQPYVPAAEPPEYKTLPDVFEARNEWHENSWWLQQSAHNPDELRALLDRVEARLDGDFRTFLLGDDWAARKDRCLAAGGSIRQYRHQRGPVTFAMSVYGVENLIFLIADEPDLADRFGDLILRSMLAMRQVVDAECDRPRRGFFFADDNCCLLTPEMYERFGYPILKGMWDHCSPDPADGRGQHSDSAMAHLLPILGRLDLTYTNFGPTLRVDEIRAHIPRAVIHGQLSPMTFCRNEEENIVREFLRDFTDAGDARGLAFTTAGSVNDGSRLTGMRLVMSAIQRFGRYDGA